MIQDKRDDTTVESGAPNGGAEVAEMPSRKPQDDEAAVEGERDDVEQVRELEAVGLEAAAETATDDRGKRKKAEKTRQEADRHAVEPPGSPDEIKGAVEALLFSLAEPIGIRALGELLGVGVHDIRSAVDELRYEYADTKRAFRLEEVAGGVQILTQSRFDPWVRQLGKKQREGRLSAAALETLSVIAYKQPLTKADLEGIRGVDCSQILRSLLDRGLIKVVGRDEGLGKALLYGTTKRFLESFGLDSIKDLPQPEDVLRESGGDS